MRTPSKMAALILLGAWLMPIASTSSEAAVRLCKLAVEGQGDAASEMEARRLALADWHAKAAAAGIQHATWRLAYGKAIVCTKGGKAGNLCKVVAEPCTVSQVPPPR